MKIFFAGSEGESFQAVLKKAGVKNILQSYYSLGFKNPPNTGGFENFLLDSGGFSARIHGIHIGVEQYADFLNKWNVKYAFNLDVMDLKTSLANQDYLIKNTNTYILPVYHGNEWINKSTRDLLDYYIECFPYIALGGMAGKENSQEDINRFLNYVFKRTYDKTMVHGLGMTGITKLQKYPVFSADSTSWLAVNKFGSSKVFSPEMAKVRSRSRHYLDKFEPELQYWLNFEKEITRLWERRGVKWGELNYEELMTKRKVMTYEEWKNERL